MTSDNSNNADSENVDKAIGAISAGEVAEAKRLLLSVIKNSPKKYSHQSTTQEGELDRPIGAQQHRT